MLGLGVSSIGDVRGAFAQNHKKLATYYAAIDAGRFPIERGYALSPDDLLRRYVITQLMCNFHVSREQVERQFGISFGDHFAPELERLSGDAVSDGFLTITPAGLDVTERGRLFVRNICMEFDTYLPAHQRQAKPVFSRTI
jgi:oxygen-independent coproporphyrinogen-3 oxidase